MSLLAFLMTTCAETANFTMSQTASILFFFAPDPAKT
jgi:hypothetical protein